MFIFDREHEWVEGQRERGGQKIWSRLHAENSKPDAGLELRSCEIMTWAQVGRPTDWAIWVPQKHFKLIAYFNRTY